MLLGRRSFLRLIGAGVVLPRVVACTGSDGDPSAPPRARTVGPSSPWPDATPASGAQFPIGLSSGEPRPDGAVLQGRYTGSGALRVRWAAWDGEVWSAAAEVGVTPASDGFFHHALTGTGPDAWIAWQAVDDAGAASDVASLITAPDAAHDGVVRLGAGSCFAQGHEAFTVLDAVLDAGPLDAFLLLGDTAYFDDEEDREDFRALYARNLTAPGFDTLRASAALISTWDDHEFTNNLDPESTPADRINLGRDAWYESLPVLPPDPEDPSRIWRRLRFGRTAEVFVLDGRTERRPSEGRYLSVAQLDWLKAALADSDATWKVIANSVPVCAFDDPRWDLAGSGRDRWEGYPEQRTELLQHIRDAGITGVLFTSGDIHCGMLARVSPAGQPGDDLWDVIAGPGGSFLNPLALFMSGERFPLSISAWNAVRMELRSDGTATVSWHGEAGEVYGIFELDDRGRLLDAAYPDEPPVAVG